MKPKASNHISACCALVATLLAVALPAFAAVTVDVADIDVAVNTSATVPVSLIGVSPEQIVSVEVFLTFDPQLVTFDSLSTTGTLVANWVLNNGFLASTVASGPSLDTLKVAGATTVDTLTADGALFDLHFSVATYYAPLTAALVLENTLLNAGIPAAMPANGSLKVTGTDGSIASTPQEVGSNGPLQITITDPDENRDSVTAESLVVQVSNGAQTETLIATETGVSTGVFQGSISAVFSPVFTSGDGILQVQSGDQGIFCYDDSLAASGNTEQRCASTAFIGALGSIDMTIAAQPVDTLRIRLVDVDLNTNALQADTVSISVVNNTTLETETILLNETGASTGIFVGRAFTVLGTGAGAAGDSTLNMQKGDLVLADYLDLATGTGVSANVLDTCQVLDPWGDASGNGQLRGFDAAEILAHAVGSTMLTGLDSLSANVDELAPFAPITAFDASLVLQRRVGLIERFPVQAKTSANHPQPESSTAPKPMIVERHLALVAREGYWAVVVEDRSDIVAGELFVEGFKGRVEAAEEARGFLVVWRHYPEGTRIALAGSRPLRGAGELLRLYPEASEPVRLVRLTRASFNDGRIAGIADLPTTETRPRAFRLLPNAPNPFNPETLIRYELPHESAVKLDVFNALGQEVRTLVRQIQSAGAYQVRWDGRDARGAQLTSGMYFYRLTTPEDQAMQKMVLLK